jgi:hypothetical protein
METPDWMDWRWRVGFEDGQPGLNIYAIVGKEHSDDDVLIGTMNTPLLAMEACQSHNSLMAQAAQWARSGGDFGLASIAAPRSRGAAGTCIFPAPGPGHIPCVICLAVIPFDQYATARCWTDPFGITCAAHAACLVGVGERDLGLR